jgi:hypothetical protein
LGTTLNERIIGSGKEVAYQEWDSGGPGAGAGRISVYRYRSNFYVFDDVGTHGPYKTFTRALKRAGIDEITDATVEVWRLDKGFTFERNTRK